MWIRGTFRRLPGSDALTEQSVRTLVRKQITEGGLRVSPDAAGFAWSPSVQLFGAEAQVAADWTYSLTGSVLLHSRAGLRAIAELEEAGFEFLPDPEIGPADAWTPASGGGLFGTRDHALRLIHAPAKPERGLGEGVNVAIVDYGIDDAWMRRECGRHGRNEGVAGGWPRYRPRRGRRREWIVPGDAPPAGLTHGQMIARNILAIAPGATIWDIPLLPDTAIGPPGISMAEAVLYYVFADLVDGVNEGDKRMQRDRGARAESGRWEPRQVGPKKRWILVNAWGALDPMRYDPFFFCLPPRRRPRGRETERDRRFAPYWNNRDNYFVRDMQRFSDHGIDVVFAAGNCGTPGMHPRCGEAAVGAGRSIHGVNAHAAVLTVGAVRADGVPIGGSAQGPGVLAQRADLKAHDACQDAIATWRRGGGAGGFSIPDSFLAKPDICAPSYFHETDGDGLVNTGTSAACGIAAGVLAALRGVEVKTGKPPKKPEEMRAILRKTARQPDGGSPRWDPRTGWGIVDFDAAKGML